MYNREAVYIVKALDMAITSISRAEYTIRQSESKTSADIEISNTLWEYSNKIREAKKKVQALYVGMNETRRK